MKDVKVRISSKLINSSIGSNKPSTVTRAAITAEIKPSRGKQLVEHNPFLLIPDPANPRPGEVIDDEWLKSTHRSDMGCASLSQCVRGVIISASEFLRPCLVTTGIR